MFRVVELPVDVALPGNDGACVVTGGDDHVCPLKELVGQELRGVIGCVDIQLGERLEHHGVWRGAGLASGRERLVSAVDFTTEEPLGHDRSARVSDADKEDVCHEHSLADRGAACAGLGSFVTELARFCNIRSDRIQSASIPASTDSCISCDLFWWSGSTSCLRRTTRFSAKSLTHFCALPS